MVSPLDSHRARSIRILELPQHPLIKYGHTVEGVATTLHRSSLQLVGEPRYFTPSCRYPTIVWNTLLWSLKAQPLQSLTIIGGVRCREALDMTKPSTFVCYARLTFLVRKNTGNLEFLGYRDECPYRYPTAGDRRSSLLKELPGLQATRRQVLSVVLHTPPRSAITPPSAFSRLAN